MPAPSVPFAWRRIAVPAYGPTLLTAAAAGAVLPVAAMRAAELGASVGVAALVLAAEGVGRLLGTLPAGRLVAVVGERRALTLAGAVDVAALLAAGWVGDLLLMALALGLSGAAASVFFLARQGYMIDVLPSHLRARGLSLVGGSMRAGLVLGPVLGAAAVGTLGLGGAYLVAVVLALLSLAVVVLAPDLTSEQERVRAAEPVAALLTVALRHRAVLATQGVGVLAISVLRTARLTILPLWALHLGLSPQHSSAVFAVAGLVELALVYPGGWLMDRCGRVWAVAPMMVVMAGAFLVLPWAQTAGQLLVVAVVMAVGNGLGSGIVMTLGADAAPTLDRAQFLAAWRMCGEVGSAAGTFGLGAVATAVSLPAAATGLGVVGLVGAGWASVWVARGAPEA